MADIGSCEDTLVPMGSHVEREEHLQWSIADPIEKPTNHLGWGVNYPAHYGQPTGKSSVMMLPGKNQNKILSDRQWWI